MPERRMRQRDSPRRRKRESPTTIVQDEQPSSRTPYQPAYQSSSSYSSSSSYIDISRTYPPHQPSGLAAIRAFFTTPSEHRRRPRRRTSRPFLRAGNSSSSSINTDLAYGTAFIRRRKGDKSRRKGKDRESGGRRDPRAEVDSDAAIREVGAELAALARKENRKNLAEARRMHTLPIRREGSRGFRGLESSRGLGSSKISHGPDEDGWESDTEANSDSLSVNSGLAYGYTWSAGQSRPGRRKSVVDPALFGPTNSLSGIIQEPVGFGDVDYDNLSDYQPPTVATLQREESVTDTGATASGPLQHVYPVPTSDPSSFDAARSSAVPKQEPYASRPAPIQIHQPQPKPIVSQNVFETSYSRQLESTIPSSPGRNESSVAGAALAGMTGADIEASIISSRQDERKESVKLREEKKDSYGDLGAKRQKEDPHERRGGANRRGKRPGLGHDELEESQEKRREGRREGERGEGERREEGRREEGRREEGRREEGRKEEGRREEGRREEGRREKERGDPDNERRERRPENRRNDDVPDDRVDRRRREKYREQNDDRYDDRQASKDAPVVPIIDPSRNQVADDAFKTLNSTGNAEPFTGIQRVRSPAIVTVERVPPWERVCSAKERTVEPVDNTQKEKDGDSRDRSRTEKEAESLSKETQNFAAPIEVSTIDAAVAPVIVEEYRQSRDIRKRRYGDKREDDSSPKRDNDPIQEEANRIYREKRSVDRKTEDPVARIITPPEMAHKEREILYPVPNADFELDHIMDPAEYMTSPIKGPGAYPTDRNLDRSNSASSVSPEGLKRPLLTLIRPTPKSTPAPEEQKARLEPRDSSQGSEPSKPKRSGSGPRESSRDVEKPEPETEQPEHKESSPDVERSGSWKEHSADTVITEVEGDGVQTSTSVNGNKGVTRGQNETMHYEVESLSETKGDPIASSVKASDSQGKPEMSKERKVTGWGVLRGAFMSSAAAEVVAKAAETSKDQKDTKLESKENSQIEPLECRGAAVEPELLDHEVKEQSPPAVGPKPLKAPGSNMPGAFEDDPEFIATLVDGLKGSGFDPNIVIKDPTYLQRSSPPGSGDPPLAEYQQPFTETVSHPSQYSISGYIGDDRPKEGCNVVRDSSEKGQTKLVEAVKSQSSEIRDLNFSQETPVAVQLVEVHESVLGSSNLGEETKREKSEKLKKDSYDEVDRGSARVSIPVDAQDDLRIEAISDDRATSKKSKKPKKKPKPDSHQFDPPSRSMSTSDMASSTEKPSKNSKDRSSKGAQYDSEPNADDISLPTVSKISRDSDYEYRESKRSSKGSSSVSDVADRDARSVRPSDNSRYGDEEDSKSGEGEGKSSGFLGRLFGSSTSKTETELSKDIDESMESRKKGKKSKRRSIRDGSEINDSDIRIPQKGDGYDKYDVDDGDTKRSLNGHSKHGEAFESKESFLDEAGTLGAGVGSVDIAQHQQSKVAAEIEERAPRKSAFEYTSVAQMPAVESRRDFFGEEVVDPEISQRPPRPSIDPQFGDLLPLPPSDPGSPNIEPDDALPSLPESCPGTPPKTEIYLPRDRSISSKRRSDPPAQVKTPSQSAVPINFIMGNRSAPSSPGMVRASSVASPSTMSPDTLSFQRPRLRPNSLQSQKEIQPLLLLDPSRHGIIAQSTELEAKLHVEQETAKSAQMGSATRAPEIIEEVPSSPISNFVEQPRSKYSIKVPQENISYKSFHKEFPDISSLPPLPRSRTSTPEGRKVQDSFLPSLPLIPRSGTPTPADMPDLSRLPQLPESRSSTPAAMMDLVELSPRLPEIRSPMLAACSDPSGLSQVPQRRASTPAANCDLSEQPQLQESRPSIPSFNLDLSRLPQLPESRTSSPSTSSNLSEIPQLQESWSFTPTVNLDLSKLPQLPESRASTPLASPSKSSQLQERRPSTPMVNLDLSTLPQLPESRASTTPSTISNLSDIPQLRESRPSTPTVNLDLSRLPQLPESRASTPLASPSKSSQLQERRPSTPMVNLDLSTLPQLPESRASTTPSTISNLSDIPQLRESRPSTPTVNLDLSRLPQLPESRASTPLTSSSKSPQLQERRPSTPMVSFDLSMLPQLPESRASTPLTSSSKSPQLQERRPSTPMVSFDLSMLPQLPESRASTTPSTISNLSEIPQLQEGRPSTPTVNLDLSRLPQLPESRASTPLTSLSEPSQLHGSRSSTPMVNLDLSMLPQLPESRMSAPEANFDLSGLPQLPESRASTCFEVSASPHLPNSRTSTPITRLDISELSKLPRSRALTPMTSSDLPDLSGLPQLPESQASTPIASFNILGLPQLPDSRASTPVASSDLSGLSQLLESQSSTPASKLNPSRLLLPKLLESQLSTPAVKRDLSRLPQLLESRVSTTIVSSDLSGLLDLSSLPQLPDSQLSTPVASTDLSGLPDLFGLPQLPASRGSTPATSSDLSRLPGLLGLPQRPESRASTPAASSDLSRLPQLLESQLSTPAASPDLLGLSDLSNLPPLPESTASTPAASSNTSRLPQLQESWSSTPTVHSLLGLPDLSKLPQLPESRASTPIANSNLSGLPNLLKLPQLPTSRASTPVADSDVSRPPQLPKSQSSTPAASLPGPPDVSRLPQLPESRSSTPAASPSGPPDVSRLPQLPESRSSTPAASPSGPPDVSRLPQLPESRSSTPAASLSGPPDVSRLPQLPESRSSTPAASLPGPPDVSRLPQLPESRSSTPAASLSGLPDVSRLPQLLESWPSTPTVSPSGLPDVSRLPQLPESQSSTPAANLSGLPDVSRLPQLPESRSSTPAASLPGPPDVSRLPQLPESWSSTPAASLSGLPDVSRLPQLPESRSSTPAASPSGLPDVSRLSQLPESQPSTPAAISSPLGPSDLYRLPQLLENWLLTPIASSDLSGLPQLLQSRSTPITDADLSKLPQLPESWLSTPAASLSGPPDILRLSQLRESQPSTPAASFNILEPPDLELSRLPQLPESRTTTPAVSPDLLGPLDLSGLPDLPALPQLPESRVSTPIVSSDLLGLLDLSRLPQLPESQASTPAASSNLLGLLDLSRLPQLPESQPSTPVASPERPELPNFLGLTQLPQSQSSTPAASPITLQLSDLSGLPQLPESRASTPPQVPGPRASTPATSSDLSRLRQLPESQLSTPVARFGLQESPQLLERGAFTPIRNGASHGSNLVETGLLSSSVAGLTAGALALGSSHNELRDVSQSASELSSTAGLPMEFQVVPVTKDRSSYLFQSIPPAKLRRDVGIESPLFERIERLSNEGVLSREVEEIPFTDILGSNDRNPTKGSMHEQKATPGALTGSVPDGKETSEMVTPIQYLTTENAEVNTADEFFIKPKENKKRDTEKQADQFDQENDPSPSSITPPSIADAIKDANVAQEFPFKKFNNKRKKVSSQEDAEDVVSESRVLMPPVGEDAHEPLIVDESSQPLLNPVPLSSAVLDPKYPVILDEVSPITAIPPSTVSIPLEVNPSDEYSSTTSKKNKKRAKKNLKSFSQSSTFVESSYDNSTKSPDVADEILSVAEQIPLPISRDLSEAETVAEVGDENEKANDVLPNHEASLNPAELVVEPAFEESRMGERRSSNSLQSSKFVAPSTSNAIDTKLAAEESAQVEADNRCLESKDMAAAPHELKIELEADMGTTKGSKKNKKKKSKSQQAWDPKEPSIPEEELQLGELLMKGAGDEDSNREFLMPEEPITEEVGNLEMSNKDIGSKITIPTEDYDQSKHYKPPLKFKDGKESKTSKKKKKSSQASRDEGPKFVPTRDLVSEPTELPSGREDLLASTTPNSKPNGKKKRKQKSFAWDLQEQDAESSLEPSRSNEDPDQVGGDVSGEKDLSKETGGDTRGGLEEAKPMPQHPDMREDTAPFMEAKQPGEQTVYGSNETAGEDNKFATHTDSSVFSDPLTEAGRFGIIQTDSTSAECFPPTASLHSPHSKGSVDPTKKDYFPSEIGLLPAVAPVTIALAQSNILEAGLDNNPEPEHTILSKPTPNASTDTPDHFGGSILQRPASIEEPSTYPLPESITTDDQLKQSQIDYFPSAAFLHSTSSIEPKEVSSGKGYFPSAIALLPLVVLPATLSSVIEGKDRKQLLLPHLLDSEQPPLQAADHKATEPANFDSNTSVLGSASESRGEQSVNNRLPTSYTEEQFEAASELNMAFRPEKERSKKTKKGQVDLSQISAVDGDFSIYLPGESEETSQQINVPREGQNASEITTNDDFAGSYKEDQVVVERQLLEKFDTSAKGSEESKKSRNASRTPMEYKSGPSFLDNSHSVVIQPAEEASREIMLQGEDSFPAAEYSSDQPQLGRELSEDFASSPKKSKKGKKRQSLIRSATDKNIFGTTVDGGSEETGLATTEVVDSAQKKDKRGGRKRQDNENSVDSSHGSSKELEMRQLDTSERDLSQTTVEVSDLSVNLEDKPSSIVTDEPETSLTTKRGKKIGKKRKSLLSAAAREENPSSDLTPDIAGSEAVQKEIVDVAESQRVDIPAGFDLDAQVDEPNFNLKKSKKEKKDKDGNVVSGVLFGTDDVTQRTKTDNMAKLDLASKDDRDHGGLADRILTGIMPNESLQSDNRKASAKPEDPLSMYTTKIKKKSKEGLTKSVSAPGHEPVPLSNGDSTLLQDGTGKGASLLSIDEVAEAERKHTQRALFDTWSFDNLPREEIVRDTSTQESQPTSDDNKVVQHMTQQGLSEGSCALLLRSNELAQESLVPEHEKLSEDVDSSTFESKPMTSCEPAFIVEEGEPAQQRAIDAEKIGGFGVTKSELQDLLDSTAATKDKPSITDSVSRGKVAADSALLAAPSMGHRKEISDFEPLQTTALDFAMGANEANSSRLVGPKRIEKGQAKISDRRWLLGDGPFDDPKILERSNAPKFEGHLVENEAGGNGELPKEEQESTREELAVYDETEKSLSAPSANDMMHKRGRSASLTEIWEASTDLDHIKRPRKHQYENIPAEMARDAITKQNIAQKLPVKIDNLTLDKSEEQSVQAAKSNPVSQRDDIAGDFLTTPSKKAKRSKKQSPFSASNAPGNAETGVVTSHTNSTDFLVSGDVGEAPTSDIKPSIIDEAAENLVHDNYGDKESRSQFLSAAPFVSDGNSSTQRDLNEEISEPSGTQHEEFSKDEHMDQEIHLLSSTISQVVEERSLQERDIDITPPQPLNEGRAKKKYRRQEINLPPPSTLPVVIEEQDHKPSDADKTLPEPKPILHEPGINNTNRDSALIAESPVPFPQGLTEDHEYARDSGVHLRDWGDTSVAEEKPHITSTDDALARLSWPAVDEKTETVDLERSQRLTAEPSPKSHPVSAAVITTSVRVATELASQAVRSRPKPIDENEESTKAERPISPNIGRLQTPENAKHRPGSVGSNRSSIRSSGTPPLRRSDRKLSGDLRSLSQRSQANLAKEAERNPTPTIVNTIPIANESRVRVRDMADVYDGYGEGRIGSPMSPTRPHSMRRRHSMQVLDLEARVEQLVAENRMLTEAKELAEHSLQSSQRTTLALADRETEVDSLKQNLDWLHREVERLTEVNNGLTSANITLGRQHNERYSALETQHTQATRELEQVRQAHGGLTAAMETTILDRVATAMEGKNQEIAQLRHDLEAAYERIEQMQRQILLAKDNDNEFLNFRDEDYFDSACQQLCQHVQQWVLRFSKFSDMRACRLTSEINNPKIIDRLDNAVLDGSDVDEYLSDRVKRRDVFMSMTMTMIWEFVFTRYLFGMDREQRQKLKTLEKTLLEVGPPAAVHQWRATTLTLLSKRGAFRQQREQDTVAVAQMIFQTLSEILPPPTHLEEQIQEQLMRVMKVAVDLSIEMRTQRAEYMMLPPLQPEYDANGDLARQVQFNAALMNERSGDTVSNEELEARHAVVRIVLFPLVVKKGDDTGGGDDEIVVCPAQVLVAKPKRHARHITPEHGMGQNPNPSRVSMQSSMPPEQHVPNI